MNWSQGLQYFASAIRNGRFLTFGVRAIGKRSPLLLLTSLLIVAATQKVAPQSDPTFPLSQSADKHYVVDQLGVPFPIVGRALWELVSLTPADRAIILNDTANRGYTAVEMRAPSRTDNSPNPPFDGDGHLPFLKRLDGAAYTGRLSYGSINNEAPDFTTPNEAYWSFVDAIFNDALARGLAVVYFPAYNGYAGGQEGWMAEMVANGSTRMQAYGAWIAARYQNQPNIIWTIAGDFGNGSNPYSGAQLAVEQAFVTGLRSVGTKLITAEPDSGTLASQLPSTVGAAITLNGIYDFGGDDIATLGRTAYALTGPVRPAIMIEEPYDQEGPDGTNKNDSATQPVRRFQWWGWLTAIGGFVHGNGYVIHFDGGGACCWKQHLNTTATQDATRQAAFMRSIPWYQLVPSGLSGMQTLITAGGGSPSSASYVAAAATPNGTYLVAYIPPAHNGSITVAMSALSSAVRARWFDPTNATYTTIGSALSNSGTRVFTPTGNNSAGQADWVLVLDTQAVAPPAPPTNLKIVQ
jgi:hypothetical protein